jgi:limonene-1,2-epoxide hydrolase
MKRCLTIILLFVAALIGVIVLISPEPHKAGPTYSEALKATSERMTELPADGPVLQTEAFQRFVSLWSNLTEESIAQHIDTVYAEDVWFNDTVKTITGHDALRHYLEETSRRVASCQVEIDDIGVSGGNYYVRWRMKVLLPDTPEESAWHSIGFTHLRFNEAGQVVLHQDYWDSAAGLYEHLPLVGWMIRAIKTRL